MNEPTEKPIAKKKFQFIRWAANGIAVFMIAYLCAYEYAGEKLYGFGAPGKTTSYTYKPQKHVTSMLRKYKSPIPPVVFVPAAWLETKVLRRQVVLAKTYQQNGYEVTVSAHTINP